MNSQFGLANIWSQAHIVIRSVAMLLLLISLASWMLIVFKSHDLFKYRKCGRAAVDFWHSEDFRLGMRCGLDI